DVAETSRGSLNVTVRDEGRTRVRDEFIVSPPVAGRLLRIELDPGAHVHAGDVVARIVPGAPAFLDARAEAEARAAVEAAEAALAAARTERRRADAELEFARGEARRIENLRGRDLASAEALDSARLEVRVAEAALAAADENLRARSAELEAARSRLLQPDGEDGVASSIDVRSPVDGRVLRVMRESEAV